MAFIAYAVLFHAALYYAILALLIQKYTRVVIGISATIYVRRDRILKSTCMTWFVNWVVLKSENFNSVHVIMNLIPLLSKLAIVFSLKHTFKPKLTLYESYTCIRRSSSRCLQYYALETFKCSLMRNMIVEHFLNSYHLRKKHISLEIIRLKHRFKPDRLPRTLHEVQTSLYNDIIKCKYLSVRWSFISRKLLKSESPLPPLAMLPHFQRLVTQERLELLKNLVELLEEILK